MIISLPIRLATTLFILLAALPICGQSSLFNIPTTDIQEKGTTYLEFDFDAHLGRPQRLSWQSFGAMAVRGVGNRSEVGINVYGLRTSEGFEPLELQPNVKFSIFESESNGFALSAGAIGYFPVGRSFHKDSSASLYAVASKSFKSKWVPRLTGGGFQLIGRNSGDNTRGFLIGIEQPIAKRLSFIADWNTAKNRVGYAAAGFGLSITRRSFLYSAYHFGNTGRGNNSFGIYYGLTL